MMANSFVKRTLRATLLLNIYLRLQDLSYCDICKEIQITKDNLVSAQKLKKKLTKTLLIIKYIGCQKIPRTL